MTLHVVSDCSCRPSPSGIAGEPKTPGLSKGPTPVRARCGRPGNVSLPSRLTSRRVSILVSGKNCSRRRLLQGRYAQGA